MALYLSKTAAGQTPVPSILSALVAAVPYEYVTTASLAAGDIIDLGPIEDALNLFDLALVTDDLDTNGTPTITLSVGLLNAGKTDLSTTFVAASTVGQTGGVARATLATAYTTAKAAGRRLGIKVVAGAATGAGAGKKVGVILSATA